jgi:4-diphosphocytidyl-2-C-methyl-D-erythritol kinase
MENKISKGRYQQAWQEWWPAPAKLNLMLKITGRREDGYHLLQTVFQLLDLSDELKFSPLRDDVVRLENPIPGVPEEDDLTVRAAKLLKQVTGYREGVSIRINKKLPMGGGLGGGSSDAATTLVVLNHLWGLGVPVEKLMEMGLSLGADVPVFVFGKAAWAEGVGEKLVEIDVPEPWYVVIKPDVHVDTGEIFSNKYLTRDSKPIRICDFLEGQGGNDCLEVVRKRYQEVDEALKRLDVFSEAKLTGTGACVFAEFDSEEAAKSAAKDLSNKWQVFVAKGQNISPLFQKIKLY